MTSMTDERGTLTKTKNCVESRTKADLAQDDNVTHIVPGPVIWMKKLACCSVSSVLQMRSVRPAMGVLLPRLTQLTPPFEAIAQHRLLAHSQFLLDSCKSVSTLEDGCLGLSEVK